MSDPGSGASILRRIEAAGGTAPRVLLRSIAGEEPDEESPATGRRSRYLTLGLIARGGVGEILKSRDGDLGRSVAMKVLREEHAESSEMIRRFVEEAQISGQLQHPGIVPVYELGLGSVGRPWFTMKLVRGESLAARLAKRADPARNLRRYLAIFERVCQTVAYVHSRGVIHRDLKPSNVMLGAYGEIQVVDWGFAKVLGQGGIVDERRAKRRDLDITKIRTVRTQDVGSESMAGSVMGTPAYMPPEQALGHVEDLDERSDVFSLGAILTEILTGSPPYVGEQEDVMVMASQARLDDAFARLDGCGADPELTDLARRCLSPLRADRPESAGEVAASVSAWLARLVERAHLSKLAAIAARTKAERAKARADRIHAEAEEHRRRRKHLLSLAAIVLGVLVAGGGILLYVSWDRAERIRQAAAAVAREEQKASLHEGRGEWEQALRFAQNARTLAEAAGERERIARVVARIEAGKRKADAAAARVAKDDALVRTLEEILPPFGYEPDGARQEAAYRAAFRGYGVDVETESPAQVASVLATSRRVKDLAGAFDRWAMLGRPGWEHLAAVAEKLEPSPLRDRIYRAVRDDEEQALDTLVGSTQMERESASVEALLGMALIRAGRSRDAILYLSGAVGRHPEEDLWIVILLARAFEAREPPHRDQARRHLIAALALRPGSMEIRHVLALATRAAGAGDERLWEDFVRMRADWAHGWVHLARARIAVCDFERAIEAGRRAVDLDPADPEAALVLAEAEILAGRIDDAVVRLSELIRAEGPAAARARALLGRARMIEGRFGEARAAFSAAGDAAVSRLDRFEEEVEVYRRWPEVAFGRAEPVDAREALAFARACLAERRHPAAAVYYERAFAAEPTLEVSHRADAARAAAAAGRGQGDAGALDPAERTRWRTQARLWAEDAFEACRRILEKGRDPGAVLEFHRLLTAPGIRPLLFPEGETDPESAAYEKTAWDQFGKQVIRLMEAQRN